MKYFTINKSLWDGKNSQVRSKKEKLVLSGCIGFAWQDFGSRGTEGVASVRSCQKLPPCLTEPRPPGSKRDLPLVKAEPISDVSSTSVTRYLRKGKNCCAIAAGRKE